ncbi:MAG: hypothetical protein BYD32DRAFT_430796, partial [Podila humilis]
MLVLAPSLVLLLILVLLVSALSSWWRSSRKSNISETCRLVQVTHHHSTSKKNRHEMKKGVVEERGSPSPCVLWFVAFCSRGCYLFFILLDLGKLCKQRLNVLLEPCHILSPRERTRRTRRFSLDRLGGPADRVEHIQARQFVLWHTAGDELFQ